MDSIGNKRLLAKSVCGDVLYSHTLPGHLQDVYASADGLVGLMAESMLQAVGISSDWIEPFQRSVRLAAALHDLGKAADVFQDAVGNNTPTKSRVRHEWISVWIACQPKVKAWLMPAINHCELCWHAAICAVAGHHPKVDRSPPTEQFFRESVKINIDTANPDFKECLSLIQAWFQLDRQLPNVDGRMYDGPGDMERRTKFLDLVHELSLYWRSNVREGQRKRFVAVVKATLIGADVAGSALWEKLPNPSERTRWITESLSRNPTREDLDQIVSARLKGSEPREFQCEVAGSKASVTLVEAGCGSGKTLAAYMWARDQHAGRRLWFCYPTTGTATEGFRGYLFDSLPSETDIRTDLFHSRSDFDLIEMMRSEVRDSNLSELRSKEEEDEENEATRIDSLRAWDTQIILGTVDNVLVLMQNQRKGLYAWPALANSAIVFDEVHCYDDVLFGNLLTFLGTLVGGPVLLMTASLPKSRRDAIRSICEKSSRSLTHIPNGPAELEMLERYRLARTDISAVTRDEAMARAQTELEVNDGRVLWISNTVDRTIGVAEQWTEEERPIVYHSRFIYEDRRDQHQELVTRFDDPTRATFATTSQVAEMSLDLGYVTLLITELAPIPAMIQRLGRLNRRADPSCDPAVICEFLVIEPVDDEGKLAPLPYESEELELAKKWLESLGSAPLSQSDLIEKWQQLDISINAFDPVKSGWLSGGPNTPVEAIREGGTGVTVILQRHENDARSEPGGATRYALSMNRPKLPNWTASDRRIRGMPIASDDAISYREEIGAKWATSNIL